MTSLQPGDKLRGKYEILRTLGTGRWGKVYLAKSISLGLQVAIKSLKRRTDLEDYDQVRQLFEQEAHIGLRLTHPNIVYVYELMVYRLWDYDLAGAQDQYLDPIAQSSHYGMTALCACNGGAHPT